MHVNERVENYPMGPRVQNWLGFSDGNSQIQEEVVKFADPSALHQRMFEDHFLASLEDKAVQNEDHLTNLMEELLAMGLPHLLVKLVDANLDKFQISDFRSQLYLGNACMMLNDHSRAEDCFRSAQKIVPEETAPYVNLTQIYIHDELFSAAKDWCLSGLIVDPNHTRLWELYAWMCQNEHGLDKAKDFVHSLSKELNSWAGTSLSHDLNTSDMGDQDKAQEKLMDLESYYNEGLRDEAFLVEFTAQLGVCGKYERIPGVVWDLRSKSKGKAINWQLEVHELQSLMGLRREDQAKETLTRLLNRSDLPKTASTGLMELKAELGLS